MDVRRSSRDGRTALVQIPMPESSLSVADHKVADAPPRPRAGGRQRDPRRDTRDLTGDYAGKLDFTSRLSHVTPLVIAFVLGLAFVLLIATFGSCGWPCR